eukprot:COSAG01_NODE_2518_length_7524_cov_2.305724_4_plen_72_part_00
MLTGVVCPSCDACACHDATEKHAWAAWLSHLLQTEGPNNWAQKAVTLGTNRTAKSLHTRWLRDEGRIGETH